jgi:hypothetical protein
MAAEQDDLLGAEPLRGDYAAEADGAVADDRDAPARRDPRGERRVVAGAHHVGKGEQRRHQRVVFANGEDDERPVGLRYAHGLGLGARHLRVAEEAAMYARGLQSVVAEDAGAVRERERHHHHSPPFQRAHLGADRVDDTDRLVSHHPARIVRCHLRVRPQVAVADTRPRHAHERVGRFDQRRVGDVLDPNIARAVHHRCSHACTEAARDGR